MGAGGLVARLGESRRRERAARGYPGGMMLMKREPTIPVSGKSWDFLNG